LLKTNIGYFLQVQGLYTALGIDIGMKTGNYITIGTSNFTVTARTLTIWLDYEQGSSILDYDYIILPNVSLAAILTIIKQYDEEQVFSCISMNKLLHSIM
jgi:hypothetical protein